MLAASKGERVNNFLLILNNNTKLDQTPATPPPPPRYIRTVRRMVPNQKMPKDAVEQDKPMPFIYGIYSLKYFLLYSRHHD